MFLLQLSDIRKIKSKNPEEIDTPRGFLIPQPYGLAVWTVAELLVKMPDFPIVEHGCLKISGVMLEVDLAEC